MIRRRVLVIDGDEPTGSALGRELKQREFDVEVCTEARSGFQKACQGHWDCVVCTPELPDIDGFWVVRRIRTEAGAIAKVPILFAGPVTDKSLRTQALAVGADVYIARPPASNEDIAAQVAALVAMAHRLDPEESAPSSTSISAAIRGDLSMFPLASMLMMFEMERRSGTVGVVAQSGKRAVLAISNGLFASTEINGAQRPALEVLREVLSWRAGRFSFQPHDSGTLPAPRASVGALVLEAMRLEDEEKNPPPQSISIPVELDEGDLVEAGDSVRIDLSESFEKVGPSDKPPKPTRPSSRPSSSDLKDTKKSRASRPDALRQSRPDGGRASRPEISRGSRPDKGPTAPKPPKPLHEEKVQVLGEHHKKPPRPKAAP